MHVQLHVGPVRELGILRIFIFVMAQQFVTPLTVAKALSAHYVEKVLRIFHQ